MTEREKKKRQYKKELNSFRNKMGNHLVWFNSLSEKSQYDILFAWKNGKYFNRLTEPIKEIRYKRIIHIRYPINFKYFILKMKRKYKPNISRIRESAINIILDKK